MFETIRKHPGAITAALIFHVLIGFLFVVGFNFTEQPELAGSPVPVTIISPQSELPIVTNIDLPNLAEQMQSHDNAIEKLEQQRQEINRYEKELLKPVLPTPVTTSIPKIEKQVEPIPVQQVNTKKLLAEERKQKEKKQKEKKEQQKKQARKKAQAKKEAKARAKKAAKRKASEKAKAKAKKEAKRKARKEAKVKARKAAKKKAKKEARAKAKKSARNEEAKKKEKQKTEEETKEKAKKEAIAKAKLEAKAKAAAIAKAEKIKTEKAAKAKAEKQRQQGMAELAAVAKAKRDAEKTAKKAADAKRASERAAQQAAQQAKAKEQLKAQARARKKALGNWGRKVVRHVRPRWQTPPGSSGMTAKVRVKVSRSGFIRSLTVVSCKGSSSFCQSIKTAFKNAEPLPSPSRKDLFDENLSLTFRR